MSFLISDAFAEGAVKAPGLVEGLLPFAIMAIFFVLFIWPQHKKGREHKKLVESLTKGNEVVTNGGLLGRIVDVDDSFVQLEVSEEVTVLVQKHMIATLMPKGTYKARKKTEK
jgi:preprotein translocase subunit YajC